MLQVGLYSNLPIATLTNTATLCMRSQYTYRILLQRAWNKHVAVSQQQEHHSVVCAESLLNGLHQS